MYERTFFSRVAAEKFADSLMDQGYEAEVWSGRDGFGQRQFFVKWFVVVNGTVVVKG